MAKAIVILDGGVVQSIIVDGKDVQVLVLDRDDPCGAESVQAAGGSAALDAMAQALPKVDAVRVERAFEAVKRGLAGKGSESAQEVAKALGV